MTECCARGRLRFPRFAERGRAAQVLVWAQSGVWRGGRISPDYYCMDGTIRASAWRRSCASSPRWRRNTACAAPTCSTPATATCIPDPVRRQRSGSAAPHRSVRRRGAGKVHRAGGTVTGEHGVGIEKINQMCVQFSPEELEQFRAVKRAFDPKELLNPARTSHAAPLRRVRKMHVRGGNVPFPGWSGSSGQAS